MAWRWLIPLGARCEPHSRGVGAAHAAPPVPPDPALHALAADGLGLRPLDAPPVAPAGVDVMARIGRPTLTERGIAVGRALFPEDLDA